MMLVLVLAMMLVLAMRLALIIMLVLAGRVRGMFILFLEW